MAQLEAGSVTVTDTMQYVKRDDGGYVTATCPNPFRRLQMVMAEEQMRDDQVFLGEHGEEALVILQDMRRTTGIGLAYGS